MVWVISQVFNNNVLLAENSEDSQQAVLLGRGLGFRRHKGEEVPSDLIHQVFVPSGAQPPAQLARLVAEIHPSQLALAQELGELARSVCGVELPDSTVVTLADHVRFAIERAIAGANESHPLAWDVRTIYPAEYRYGRYGLDLIRERTGVALPDSEATALALHIVNAEVAQQHAGPAGPATPTDPSDFSRTARMSALIQQAVDIVVAETSVDPGSAAVARLITHMRFLVRRLIEEDEGAEAPVSLAPLRESLVAQYPQANALAHKVALALSVHVGRECSPEEVTYLIMHCARVLQAAAPSTPPSR